MKTLDQIDAKLEPRTPITSAPFTIGASGSYYLAKNLTVTTGDAISITADDVTLDLNGFTISSAASPASGTGVLISGARRDVTIKNGNIRGGTGFSSGAFSPQGFLVGVNASTPNANANLRIFDLNVSGMASHGINLGGISVPTILVERCNVSVCAGIGILAAAIRDCNVDTAGRSGIFGDIVSRCSTRSVSTVQGDSGIAASSVVESCVSLADVGSGIICNNGQVSNSRGTSNSGIGLSANCASNSQGISDSLAGLVALTNATNCTGISNSGNVGLSATGTASFCRGKRDGGFAISASIAIGCTVSGTGTVLSDNKFLGTP